MRREIASALPGQEIRKHCTARLELAPLPYGTCSGDKRWSCCIRGLSQAQCCTFHILTAGWIFRTHATHCCVGHPDLLASGAVGFASVCC